MRSAEHSVARVAPTRSRERQRVVRPLLLPTLATIALLALTACGDRPPKPQTPHPKPAVAPATAWPMTRGGPALTGHVDRPAPRAPQTAWTFTADGPITAEAAIFQNRVYIGTGKGTLHALAADTGKELWKFTSKDAITAAPAVSATHVFVSSNDGSLYALDPTSGRELWKFSTEEKISSGAILIPAPASPQTLHPTPPTSGSAPRASRPAPPASSDWLLLNGYDGTTRVLHAADGKLVWSYQTDNYINGAPAVVDGRFLVFGGCDALLHVVNLADGKRVHAIDANAYIPASIATFGTMAFCGNYANQTVAFDVVAGKQAWVYEDRQLPFFSSPAVNDKLVLIGSRDKHLHAINRTTGESVWKFPTGGRVEASPIMFSDAAVFGSADGRLYAANLADGTELWRLELGEPLVANPAFGENLIILGGEKGTLFALKGK